jgi:hypothetical protein
MGRGLGGGAFPPDWDQYQTGKPSEFLRAALEDIDAPEKWTRGDYFHGDQACAVGAISKGSIRRKLKFQSTADLVGWDTYNVVFNTLRETFKETLPNVAGPDISDFNDDPRVTYDDVVAAFQKAATKLEEKGQ